MKCDKKKFKKTITLIKNTFLSKKKEQIHEYRKSFDWKDTNQKAKFG
jgi:hypothetical protein